mgnify:CR=1 FL=1
MCGRYVIVSPIEQIEKRFNVRSQQSEYSNPNIAPGEFAPVITADRRKELQFFQFGLTPSWAKKQMYVINARAEGDRNQDNNPNYHGSMGIIMKPMFKGLIRRQRCLVLADAFMEGSQSEKLSNPYLIFPRDKKRPFAMAGVWDTWADSSSGELVQSFAILTTVANDLLQKIGHHRAPLILPPYLEGSWLSNRYLADVTSLMKPFNPHYFNAYPISKEIKDPSNKEMKLLNPLGERIYRETDRQPKKMSYDQRQKNRRANLYGK